MKTVKYAGYGLGVDEIVIDKLGAQELDPNDPKFIAYYGKKGKLIALAAQSIQHEPVVAKVAQFWKNDVYLSMDEIRGPASEGKSFDLILKKLFLLNK